jgi:small GTP-binding protein
MTELSILKIGLFGPKGSGKSALSSRIAGIIPEIEYRTTIGVDFMVRIFEDPIKFHIWDLGGDIKYQSISSSYLKSAKVIIAVYDSSSNKSLLECASLFRKYIREGKISRNQNVIIVGTNYDKIPDKYSASVAKELAESVNGLHVNVSSKSGEGIDEIVDILKIFAEVRPLNHELHKIKIEKVGWFETIKRALFQKN